ncbi:MAG: RagB/SusD family nutrient uptake outer membrane protein [Prevotellaceae bacterium]|jgi:hypothetical protein|nr:RagB/SusD family nutrient uptake outer membrane protein [Prevotellaceae bacterium]
MKKLKKLWFIASIALITGCAGYLDVIPDNVATMEHAFSNRAVTERFLFGCYNYLPNPSAIWDSPALLGGDELWWNIDAYNSESAILLAQGFQNRNNPYHNYWDGENGGKNIFIGIRDCNIFLENVHLPYDIEDYERSQWAAEAKVLKAYFHFFLLQLYGPIPIVRENLPVDALVEEVRTFREPVDEVIDYIVTLLDEAMPDLLPNVIYTGIMDAGRITQPIAAAIKAKALVWAASPLFNGTEDTPPLFSLVDKRGTELFPQTYQAEKWTRAATAIKEAIDICREMGHQLFEYNRPAALGAVMSDATLLKYTLRGAVTDKFNTEIVWPDTHNTNPLQQIMIPNINGYSTSILPISEIGPTLKIAEEYYTKNGIPTDEDPEWIEWLGGNYEYRYQTLQSSTNSGGIDGAALSDYHRYYIKNNETTAKLHFYREPRFYAHVGFDRGIWEANGNAESVELYLQARSGEEHGVTGTIRHTTCGYHTKKMVNLETFKSGSTYTPQRYPFPLIRLADLYLLYAEALNESKTKPDTEVYQWIDSIRRRAGLEGVVNSWKKSSVPNKPTTKEGMREIIKRERMIELAYEGQRFWDLRRWTDAERYMNEPVRGWYYNGNNVETYYQVTTYWDQRIFRTRDYLWPLKLNTLIVNTNLIQNPGW